MSVAYIIFRPGYGDTDIYVRRRRRVDDAQQYWNFTSLAWVDAESADTKVFLSETVDTELSSIYNLALALPDIAFACVEEAVIESTSEVISQTLLNAASPEETDGTALQAILDLAMQRVAALKFIPKMPFMDTANMVIDILYKRLVVKRSDLTAASFSRTVLADVATCSVPSDFMAMLERPYITGYTYPLSPLPPELRSSFTSTGTPRYYELRGSTITLYPTPSANITINFQYRKKATKFAAFTDIVPFNTLIDDLLMESVVRGSESGLALLVDPVFKNAMYSQLEEMLPFRAPRQVTFMQTVEGGQRNARGGNHPDFF